MFKVGDHVVHRTFGKGKVLAVYIDDLELGQLPFFVEFKNAHGALHNGGFKGVYGKPGHCYWCSAGRLVIDVVFKGNKHATAS